MWSMGINLARFASPAGPCRKEYDILGRDAASWLREQGGARPSPGGVAPDMAEYMAKQQQARQQTSEAFAARKRREAAAAARKATEDFMAEVDDHIRKTSENCGSWRPSAEGSQVTCHPPMPAAPTEVA